MTRTILEFCREVLGIEPTAAQALLLNALSMCQLVVAACGRRSGKSLMAAICASYDATMPDLSEYLRPGEGGGQNDRRKWDEESSNYSRNSNVLYALLGRAIVNCVGLPWKHYYKSYGAEGLRASNWQTVLHALTCTSICA